MGGGGGGGEKKEKGKKREKEADRESIHWFTVEWGQSPGREAPTSRPADTPPPPPTPGYRVYLEHSLNSSAPSANMAPTTAWYQERTVGRFSTDMALFF